MNIKKIFTRTDKLNIPSFGTNSREYKKKNKSNSNRLKLAEKELVATLAYNCQPDPSTLFWFCICCLVTLLPQEEIHHISACTLFISFTPQTEFNQKATFLPSNTELRYCAIRIQLDLSSYPRIKTKYQTNFDYYKY